MARERIDILGVQIDRVTMAQAKETVLSFMDAPGVHIVFTPNSEMIQAACRDSGFADVLNRAELLTPDGIGVVYASRILKQPLTERVAGYDLVCNVVETMALRNKKVFLFGSKPGVAEEAGQVLETRYPGIVIAGIRDGYFTDTDVPAIIDQINAMAPDLLLVCLGFPKQEKWIAQNKDKLNARVVIGAGGTLDALAGRVQRAPERWQRLGLEWLYRLKQEPARLGRMMALPAFGFSVLLFGKRAGAEKKGAGR